MILAPLSLKTAGFIFLAAATQPACPSVSAPNIVVEMRVKEPVINHKKTIAQMKLMRMDTTMPFEMRQFDHLDRGGMMSAEIQIHYGVKTSPVPGNTAETVNMHCVRYDNVDITLTLAPKIFVARDYADHSCYYQKTLQHELGHVDMDKVVVEKYRMRLQDGLSLAFSGPQDAIAGPVAKRKIKALEKKMGEQIVGMTNGLLADMVRERQEKQQAVDSVQNYAYIMNACYDDKAGQK